jgi:hypothetical protein
MLYDQPLAAVDPMRLAMLTGITKIARFSAPVPPVVRPFLLTHQLRGCHCDGGMAVPPDYGRLRGMGQTDSTLIPADSFNVNALQVPSAGSGNYSVLQTAALGANFVPGVGQIGSIVLTAFNQFLNQFESWFHIGAGRREENIIVPVQNSFVSALGQVTNQFVTGQSPDCDQLSSLYRQVWMMAVAFQEFVLMRQFTDRRASGQALNTVMPYIDGSCGYSIPVGFTATPGTANCGFSWGDGTIGGVGTNGMLGALSRALQAQGCSVPALPDLHQAANSGIRPASVAAGYGGLPATIMGVSTPLALAVGVFALFMYKRGF